MFFDVNDHRPILLGAAASVTTAVVHNLVPPGVLPIVSNPHETLELVRLWIGLVGQCVGILAGVGSFCWYMYNFQRERKKKGIKFSFNEKKD